MKKYSAVVLHIVVLVGLVSAQTSELSSLRQKFRSFDYDGVIELANEFLTRSDQYNESQLISIYEMKAMAHYSLSELDAAQYAFESILKLDFNYSPDPVKTSPKIIDFFDSIKKDVRRETESDDQSVEKPTASDTLTVVQDRLGIYQKSIPASLVLPGSGHFVMGDKKRGVLLTGASLLSLSTALYFTGQTRDKERDYMNAIDEADISSSYKSYNSAYKTRNVLWAAYAAVWIYAQTDLIFFQEKRQNVQVFARPSFSPEYPSFISLTLSF